MPTTSEGETGELQEREEREREGKGTSERDRAVHFAQQRQLDPGIITGVSTIIMDIYHRPGYYYYF